MKKKLLYLSMSFFYVTAYSQDSLFSQLKLSKEKVFYDTVTEFCLSSNYDIQTQSFSNLEKWVRTYDQSGNCTREEYTHEWNGWSNGYNKTATNYNYDIDNNLLEVEFYSWDSIINSWNSTASAIRTKTYNLNSSLLTDQTDTYDTQNLTYNTTSKSMNQYDLNNNLTKHSVYAYSQNNDSLYLNYIRDYEYDLNNNVTMQLDSNYNEWNSQWELDSILYGYDTFGRLTSNENSHIMQKKTYSYDANDNNILEIHFLWDTLSNNWIYGSYAFPSKYERFYDANNNLIQIIAYHFDNSFGSFIPYSEINQFYDGNNNMIESNGSFFNDTINAMEITTKTEYTFDNTNRMIQSHQFIWDSNTSAWTNSSLFNYDFDNNDNEIYYDNLYWSGPSTGWVFCCKYEACSILTTNIREKETKDISIFPNPTTDNIYLKNVTIGSKIELYNTTGKQLASYRTINDNHSINLKEIGGSGFYLLRIESPNTGEIITKKVILK